MKTFIVYLLFGLIFVSRQGVWGQETRDYINDEDEDEEDDGSLDEDESNGQSDAQIVSQPKDEVVQSGTTVTFPCLVQNLDDDIVEWYFGSTRLFIDDLPMVTDSRIQRTPESLSISNVISSDSGNYSCVLVNSHKHLNHSLKVSTAAQILEFSDGSKSEHVTWLKGTKQSIFCDVIGYPQPSVTITHTWIHGKHRSKEVQSLSGNPVVIEHVERKHAGKYICTASNDLFRSEKVLHVEVRYAPQIHIKRDYINSAEGIETEVVCRIQAFPTANVTWYKDGRILSGGKWHEDVDGAIHKIVIYKTQMSDFGRYKCEAVNSLGRASMSITVSGVPSRPVIQSATFDDDAITPVLTWNIRSMTPITEYLLEYKKQENNEWMTVTKAVEEPSTHEHIYLAKHKFDDLEEGTYHARIKALNNYGWSELSDEKIFSGNKASIPRAANSYSHLESIRQGSGGPQLRISLVFLFSLLVAHCFH